MMVKVIQSDLSGGEVSPAIGARVDISRYRESLSKCENYFVRAQGGVLNRAGLQFVAEVKDSSKTVNLHEFEFNTTQTYVLEIGDQYIRFHTGGGLVLESTGSKTITAATSADPVVITSTAHGLSNGDEVFITGVVGMTELNNRQFKVNNVAANTFELQDMGGTNIDGSAYTSYVSGGSANIPYEISTPYLEANLNELSFVQSADVMTICHPSYAPRDLTRTANDAWTLTEITFQPEQVFPTGVSVTVNSTGSETDRYVVTAINRETSEESLRGLHTTTETISNITQADPAVATITGHPYVDGDEIYIQGVVGMTEINNKVYLVSNSATNTFELQDTTSADIDSTGYTAYSSGGSSNRQFFEVTNSNTTRDNTISWTSAVNAESYAVYREDNGLYGFIGNSETNSFTDDNIAPDVSDTPPKFRNPFVGTGNFPSVSGFFKQRKVFANTDNRTQTLFLSQTGNFKNFSVSSPPRDGDSITATIASTKANEIRGLVPIKDLIVMTSGAEWSVTGPDGIIRPADIQVVPQTYYGSDKVSVPPLVAGETVLYLQPGQIVRDLGYQFANDAYSGNDISILARHLLDFNEITDWTFAIAPYSIVWAVRDDGVMLGLTYLREQEKFAWHRHTTKGKIKSVAAVREGTDDRLYVLAERTIGSRTVKYVERMDDRKFTDIQDAIFVDASVTFDNPIAISGYTLANPVVVTTSSSHGFSNGDTVDIEGINVVDATETTGFKIDTTDINGTGYTVANVTATTFELQNNGSDVDGTGFATYRSGGNVRKAITEVPNLWHLEGESVAGLANGYVVSGTVTNGTLTLADPSSRIHIGLGYTSEIETLRLDTGQGSESIQGKNKKIGRMSVTLDKTIGMKAGVVRSRLREVNFSSPALWGQPPEMFTGVKDFTLPPDWNKDGTYVLRQDNPLPSTILALIPDAVVGGN
jgi:hypothetical protein